MKYSALAGLASVVLGLVLTSADNVVAQVRKPAPKPSAARPRPATPSAAKPAPLSSLDSLSYSIGVNVAQSLKQQGLSNVNTNLLAQGIGDALKGESTVMAEETANRILTTYMQKQYEARMVESRKEAEANRKLGDAFLAENKAKAGVKTTQSGLQYVVEKEGTGPRPDSTSRVKVHYTGRLLDGTVFDSSVERGPAEFGVTQVIPGWVEALQLMPVGSKWKLFIPAQLAYGDQARGQDIKPGSTLIFDVELLEIVK